jgi:hypothetical protein
VLTGSMFLGLHYEEYSDEALQSSREPNANAGRRTKDNLGFSTAGTTYGPASDWGEGPGKA